VDIAIHLARPFQKTPQVAAFPARGEGLAILKWITSFPGNPRLGLPTVKGALVSSVTGWIALRFYIKV
jgi:ornithine cyclodeaminase/alanine dehydrogenase-like protein (mu-crystallin family)